jgi:integrase
MIARRRRETPTSRINPSGEKVWIARYTDRRGRRRSAGTFRLRREAQAAIDTAYEAATHLAPETVGEYAITWTSRHPRSQRTNETNEHRLSRVLDVELEGLPLGDWPLRELRRRHAVELVDHLLGEGRAALGAINLLRTLSAMTEDAITDEIAEVNAFKGLRVRANDPRVRKPRRRARVLTWEQMLAFSEAAGTALAGRGRAGFTPTARALVRTFRDTGMRLGEVLPLRRSDLRDGVFEVRRTAHEGLVQEGVKTDHGDTQRGRLVPCPPGLWAAIRAVPARIDTDLLFPTPTGRLWRERNFYRDIWQPARELSKLEATPHDFRHSFVSLLVAADVDEADLAEIAGHTVQTLNGVYRHPLSASFDRVRGIIG